MEMVRMITTSPHVYAGKALSKGEEFDCEKQHVHLMTVIGRARVKEETAPADEPKSTYLTRDMTARRGKRSK